MRAGTARTWSACVIAASLVAGCAGKQDAPSVGFTKGAYRAMLERQQRGLPVEAREVRPLPQMTVEDYERLGDHYLRHGNLTMGFAQYDRALRMDPGRSGLAYKVGVLFLKKGLPDDAGRQFQAMLDRDPADAWAHAGLGQVHLALGDLILASAELRQALALDPTLWKVHNLLGIVYDRRGLHSDAVVQYRAALLVKPDEPAVLNNLGMSYYATGRYEEAVRAFQEAVEKGVTETRILNNLALALAKLERFHEGLLALQRGGDEARALNNLGILYLQAGKPYNAVYYFEKAIHASPVYYRRAHENLKQARLVIARRRAVTEEVSAGGPAVAVDVGARPASLRAKPRRATPTRER